MSWFKDKVEDFDMAGKALREAERSGTVRDVKMHKFNPDIVQTDLLGQEFSREKAVDSQETIEFEDEVVIQAAPGMTLELNLDADLMKIIAGE